MADFSVVDHTKIDLSKSLLVLGFPSVGLVGNIATAYLVDVLKMPHVASVVSDAFPPTAAWERSRQGEGLCFSWCYLLRYRHDRTIPTVANIAAKPARNTKSFITAPASGA